MVRNKRVSAQDDQRLLSLLRPGSDELASEAADAPATADVHLSASTYSRKDLSSLSSVELKNKCKDFGLRASGTKAELIARLEEHADHACAPDRKLAERKQPQQKSSIDEWFANATAVLVEHAQRKIESGSKQNASSKSTKQKAAAKAEAQNRMAALATSSDRVGVSFAGGAFQERYFVTKFERRGRLCYDVLCDLSLSFPDAHIRVASFGGGPGTDASGLVWLQRERFRDSTFDCVLYDRETSWKRYLVSLRELFGQRILLNFAPCDVTQSVSHHSNMKVCVADVDLMLFFYVCHETSALTEQSEHVFYIDIAKAAKAGCIVVIADVLDHSRDAIAAVTAAFKSVREVEEMPLKRDHNTHVVALRFSSAKQAPMPESTDQSSDKSLASHAMNSNDLMCEHNSELTVGMQEAVPNSTEERPTGTHGESLQAQPFTSNDLIRAPLSQNWQRCLVTTE